MSQPLSNMIGEKRSLTKDSEAEHLGKRVKVNVQEPEPVERQVPLRDIIVLMLVGIAFVCIPLGTFIAFGVGPGLIAVGVLALISGLAVGLL